MDWFGSFSNDKRNQEKDKKIAELQNKLSDERELATGLAKEIFKLNTLLDNEKKHAQDNAVRGGRMDYLNSKVNQLKHELGEERIRHNIDMAVKYQKIAELSTQCREMNARTSNESSNVQQREIADLKRLLEEEDASLAIFGDEVLKLNNLLDKEKKDHRDNVMEKDKEIEVLKKRNKDLEGFVNTLEALINVVKPGQQNEIQPNSFNDELNDRMMCEICMDDTISRCCPECRKGLCGNCHNQIPSRNGQAPCPFCRTESDNWNVVCLPRI